MAQLNEFEKHDEQNLKNLPKFFISPTKIIVTYTMLSMLVRMRKKLGLEAMIEYIEKYIRVIDRYNPKIKSAVAIALKMTNVEKMYEDVR